MILGDSESDDDMAPGWEERVTTDGKVYYANHENQTTQWDHPTTGKRKRIVELPFGWEMTVTDNNTVLYVDHVNQKTTYTDPRLAFAIEDKNDPISEKFHNRLDGCSTSQQVLHGKYLNNTYAIVTGASSGLGFETAISLAFSGAHVIMATRNVEKAQMMIESYTNSRTNLTLKLIPMFIDLCDLSSVLRFANDYLNKNWPLNLLILNAGEMMPPFKKSVDGYETTFQSHFLGHFYLCSLLKNSLITSGHVSSGYSRVIAVSCEAHWLSNILPSTELCEETFNPSPKTYDSTIAYCNASLCKILFIKEFNRRMIKQRVISHAVHPGNLIDTAITRHCWWLKVVYCIARPFAKSVKQGAATILYAGTSNQVSIYGGCYIMNCSEHTPSQTALSEQLAKRLWSISELMIQKSQSLKKFYELKPFPLIDNKDLEYEDVKH